MHVRVYVGVCMCGLSLELHNSQFILHNYCLTFLSYKALVLQTKGILVRYWGEYTHVITATTTIPILHIVHLSAPDSVLLERYAGKRVDPITGG